MDEIAFDIQRKSRKRKRNPENHKRNVIKNKILRGEEYISHTGRMKRAKYTGQPCR